MLHMTYCIQKESGLTNRGWRWGWPQCCGVGWRCWSQYNGNSQHLPAAPRESVEHHWVGLWFCGDDHRQHFTTYNMQYATNVTEKRNTVTDHISCPLCEYSMPHSYNENNRAHTFQWQGVIWPDWTPKWWLEEGVRWFYRKTWQLSLVSPRLTSAGLQKRKYLQQNRAPIHHKYTECSDVQVF